MSKPPRILDPSGKPLPADGDSDDDEGLSPAVRALIENRLNSATDGLRERNQADLKDLAREYSRKWRWMTIVSAVLILSGILYVPTQIKTWVNTQVDNKLTEPMIKESANRVIADRMEIYVEDHLKPLRNQAKSLEESLTNTRKDIATKQGDLERQQNDLSSRLKTSGNEIATKQSDLEHQQDDLSSRLKITQKDIATKQGDLERQQDDLSIRLKISELAIAAKAGSRKAFSELTRLAKTEARPADYISASLRETELFFDADRSQLAFPILVLASTLQDPGYSVDELVAEMRLNPAHAEASINSISKLKSKACVRELCNYVANTEDLRGAARATRALNEIVTQDFRPLEFEKVANWWATNSTDVAYQGLYDNYVAVISEIWKGQVTKQMAQDFVTKLSVTCHSDPDALHARCLKAGLQLMIGSQQEADSMFSEVDKKNSNYRWLFVWRAAEQIQKSDLKSAIDLINKAFSVAPDPQITATIDRWEIFLPIRGNNEIHWPKINGEEDRK